MKRRPLETEIAHARAEKAAADARLASLLMEQARLVDAVVELEEHRVLDLHTEEKSSSVKHMHTAISQKSIGRPLTSKHPFPARCVALHGSVLAAAKTLGFKTSSTIRSWYAEGPEGRPIPELWVERLSKKPWSIPRGAWRLKRS